MGSGEAQPTVRDDPVRGRLYVWPDGIELPSVTTIITRGLGLTYDAPEAAARGTTIHEACALLDGGGDGSGLDWRSVPEEWHGYLRSWETAKQWIGGTVGEIELPVRSTRYRYAGRLDRVLGDRIVVDIKTGAEASWHRLQTAAYAYALRETLRTSTWFDRASAYLRESGTPLIADHSPMELSGDFRVFLAAAQVYEWRAAMKDRGRHE